MTKAKKTKAKVVNPTLKRHNDAVAAQAKIFKNTARTKAKIRKELR